MNDKEFNNKIKSVRFETGVGTVRYSWLDKTETIDGTDTGKFSLTVDFDPMDDEYCTFLGQYTKLHESANKHLMFKDADNMPYKVTDENMHQWKFKTKFPAPIVDVHGVRLSDPLFGGSKVSVIVQPIVYTTFGGGVACRLKAIQVLELVTGSQDVALFKSRATTGDDDVDNEVESEDLDFS